MTELDRDGKLAGYYPSAWPVECGGPRRQKLVSSPGLALKDGERLLSTTRQMDGWAVMQVQRAPGEIFVQGGAGLGQSEFPPQYRDQGDTSGWLERIDPITLKTLARSPELPSGGHLWCGAVVVHENGDLYMVNGRYCHRLDEDCRVVAERKLPVDAPYNGLLILSDGNLLMKNLGTDPSVNCKFSLLEPERLESVGEPLEIPEACMGRFSSDRTKEGEFVYFTSATKIYRLRYEGGRLMLDSDWQGSYEIEGEDQGDGWDTSVGSDCIWMMDMGRPPPWRGLASAPQRAFRFPIDDPGERDVIETFGMPNAVNVGPPLYDPERRILVAYDMMNGKVGAWRFEGPGQYTSLWQHDWRCAVQMILYSDTGELVLEDGAAMGPASSAEGSMAVVVDIETGRELGRAPSGAPSISGMFFCPGYGRDFYSGSLRGAIARYYVEG